MATRGAASFVAGDKATLNCASNSSLQTGNVPCWVTLWIYPTVAGASWILQKAEVTNREWGLVKEATNVVRFNLMAGNASTILKSVDTAALTLSTWNFILAWYDPTSAKIYIRLNNNSPVASTTIASPPTTGNGALSLGGTRNTVSSSFFTGSIDSTIIGKPPTTLGDGTSGTLAKAIGDSLYNSGSGKDYASITPTEHSTWGTVSAWELDETTGTRLDSHGTNHLTETFTNIIDATTLNGGFETAGAGGADVLANWTESVSGGSTIVRNTASPIAGTADCQFIIDASNNSAFISQTLTATGRQYVGGVTAKISSLLAGPNLRISTAGGAASADWTLTTSPATYSSTFTASATNFALARVNATSRTITIDSVTLRAAEIPGAAGKIPIFAVFVPVLVEGTSLAPALFKVDKKFSAVEANSLSVCSVDSLKRQVALLTLLIEGNSSASATVKASKALTAEISGVSTKIARASKEIKLSTVAIGQNDSTARLVKDINLSTVSAGQGNLTAEELNVTSSVPPGRLRRKRRLAAQVFGQGNVNAYLNVRWSLRTVIAGSGRANIFLSTTFLQGPYDVGKQGYFIPGSAVADEFSACAEASNSFTPGVVASHAN